MREGPVDPVQTLTVWLQNARNATIFSGAGMSTESGLPDFRSAGGLWRNNRRFEELASTEALAHHYDEFVAFYRWRIEELAKFAPHEGHRVLARWQARGLLQALITQNVDGFHQRAGSPQPFQLHGGLDHVRCQTCGLQAPAEKFLSDTACEACGGKLRPGVVLFGEMLPRRAFEGAEAAARAADLFIVLGSSLMVSPANMLPQLAKSQGAKLVIVNQDPTPLDGMADLVLRDAIGPTLAAVDALMV
ncbi:MAG: NAD-dependent deacetylase [Cyanobacteria bacterium RYN_339]|nr:NAD-dependent deacetylase [Cyanobacteria bacterium RYN_339]